MTPMSSDKKYYPFESPRWNLKDEKYYQNHPTKIHDVSCKHDISQCKTKKPTSHMSGIRNYVYVRDIGGGSFGRALLVKDVSLPDERKHQLYVMKVIDILRLGPKERKDAINEVRLLSSLRHPYIISYKESFLEKGCVCIVMEYAAGGDLHQAISLHKKHKKKFSEAQILRWLTQAILALKYLHEKHILHRDLKSQNMFLTSSGKLCIGDFGIAKILHGTAGFAETQIGTPYFLSPEICQNKPYSWASDIWALGCVLYELATFEMPFDALNIGALVYKIIRETPPLLPASYSDDLRRICADCLRHQWDLRPTANELLQTKLIQNELRLMFLEQQQISMKRNITASISSSRSLSPIRSLSPYRFNTPRNDHKTSRNNDTSMCYPSTIINDFPSCHHDSQRSSRAITKNYRSNESHQCDYHHSSKQSFVSVPYDDNSCRHRSMTPVSQRRQPLKDVPDCKNKKINNIDQCDETRRRYSVQKSTITKKDPEDTRKHVLPFPITDSCCVQCATPKSQQSIKFIKKNEHRHHYPNDHDYNAAFPEYSPNTPEIRRSLSPIRLPSFCLNTPEKIRCNKHCDRPNTPPKKITPINHNNNENVKSSFETPQRKSGILQTPQCRRDICFRRESSNKSQKNDPYKSNICVESLHKSKFQSNNFYKKDYVMDYLMREEENQRRDK